MIAALGKLLGWSVAPPLSPAADIAAAKDRNAQIAARLCRLEAEILRERSPEVRDARVQR